MICRAGIVCVDNISCDAAGCRLASDWSFFRTAPHKFISLKAQAAHNEVPCMGGASAMARDGRSSPLIGGSATAPSDHKGTLLKAGTVCLLAFFSTVDFGALGLGIICAFSVRCWKRRCNV